MAKYTKGILLAFLTTGIIIFSVPPSAMAAALTQAQIQAIIGLLQSFRADPSVVASVRLSLNGGTSASQSGETTIPACSTPSISYAGIPDGFKFTRALDLSSASGHDISYLKIILAAAGCFTGDTSNTAFGQSIQQAVVCFKTNYQCNLAKFTNNHIKINGSVGLATVDYLNSLLSSQQNNGNNGQINIPNTTGPSTTVPTIASISPTSGIAGTSVTVYGTGFVPSDIIYLSDNYGGQTLSPVSVSSDGASLTFTMPSGNSVGTENITVGGPNSGWKKSGTQSNQIAFTVTLPLSAATPVITSIFPSSGSAGRTVTISGSGFLHTDTVYFTDALGGGSYPNSSNTTANTLFSTISPDGTSMTFKVPSLATGNYTISVGWKDSTINSRYHASNWMPFAVVAKSTQPVTVISPNGGESYTVSADGSFSIPFSWQANYTLKYPWAYLMNSTAYNVPAVASIMLGNDTVGGSSGGQGTFTALNIVDKNAKLTPGQYWVKICDQESDMFNPTCDTSDASFTIASVAPNSGYCELRDMYTSIPSQNAPDVGRGYAKMAKPAVNTISGLQSACSTSDYSTLLNNYCSLNSNAVQQGVVVYDPNGNFLSTSCGSFGCNNVSCPTSTAQPSITVTSPNAGAIFSSPTGTIPFSWTWSGVNASVVPTVYLLDQNGNTVYGELGTAGGLSYSSQGGSGTFPAPVNLVIPTGTAQYRVEICLSNTNCVTGGYFIINKTLSSTMGLYPGASITVNAPQSGETLQSGSQYTITWTNSGLPANATQYIMIMNGTSGTISDPNTAIVSNLPSTTTSYNWTVTPNTGWAAGMGNIEQKIAGLLGIQTALADTNQYVIVIGADMPGVTGDIASGKSGVFMIAYSGSYQPSLKPSVNSLYPSSGPAGTEVTITGTGFNGAYYINSDSQGSWGAGGPPAHMPFDSVSPDGTQATFKWPGMSKEIQVINNYGSSSFVYFTVTASFTSYSNSNSEALAALVQQIINALKK